MPKAETTDPLLLSGADVSISRAASSITSFFPCPAASSATRFSVKAAPDAAARAAVPNAKPVTVAIAFKRW